MGDPRAVTAQGQEPELSGGLIGALTSVVDGAPGLPEERKNRLLRLGYVEINGPRIGNHQYEPAEAVEPAGRPVALPSDSATGRSPSTERDGS